MILLILLGLQDTRRTSDGNAGDATNHSPLDTESAPNKQDDKATQELTKKPDVQNEVHPSIGVVLPNSYSVPAHHLFLHWFALP